MKKVQHGILGITLLFIVSAFTCTAFAYECVAPPAAQNCLQCHSRSNIHAFHFTQIGLTDPAECLLCHNGGTGSPCRTNTGPGPVETSGCANCHSQCYEVQNHIPRGGNCTDCHVQTNEDIDDDCDGICNPGVSDVSCTGSDNCPSTPNGPNLGTCTKGVKGRTCIADYQCGTGGVCSTNQEDTSPAGGNGVGDACDCEGNFDCDLDQDGTDAAVFKKSFGRSTLSGNPCTYDNPCYGNFDGDSDSDGTDSAVFKSDFGRTSLTNPCPAAGRPVGVLFTVHGGTDTNVDQYIWDTGVQQFSYDPNNSVYKLAIWNPAYWDFVLTAESSLKFMAKYDFEYPRIGGTDPFGGLTLDQLSDMETELENDSHNIDFATDWAGWMCGDCIDHYPYPRFIYYGPDGPGVGTNCTYCGEGEPGGPWPGCDPNRYNVDGPIDRLLKQGVYRIIMVDLTVGGVRFSKTYDVKNMSQKRLDEWKNTYGITVPLLWVNDYSDLMKRSYPILPAGWTRSTGALPTQDSEVLLNGSPNPVAADPDLATLQREAIEASFSGTVSDANTGVIILNHAINDLDEVFDPKLNDTVVLNENIKDQLVALHPTMDPDNIIGARMGVKELNPEAEHSLLERTIFMRGENLGHQYLYETTKEFPSSAGYPNPSDPRGKFHPWGYLYWDAIDYLVNTKGVQHIVVGFTQIITSSALDMVEIPNQIGKEIGIKNWALWSVGDFTRYPVVGHPFADYWGNWVYQDCGEWELLFDGGTSQIAGGGTNPVSLEPGAKLVGQTSGATGIIKQVAVESGSWAGGNAAGRIVLKDLVGSFSDNETIRDDKTPFGNALANGTETQTLSSDCCFVMGGCADDPLPRPYPAPRLTPLPDRAHDLDPSLAYDLSDFGHLGYDPLVGAPDPNNPVQDQYTGTWEMYAPPDNDPRVGQLLAKQVVNAIIKPMVYLSNGEKEGTAVGQSVTFQATVVTGGTSPYTYAWSIKEAADPGWTTVGSNSTTWAWTPQAGDEGTYAVRCVVTDSKSQSGEIIWEGFGVTAAP